MSDVQFPSEQSLGTASGGATSIDELFTDAELTELALAADPRECLSLDAVPVAGSERDDDGPLPSWYMPPVARVVTSPTRRVAAIAVVAGFLLIDALGLCVTYGVVSL